MKQRLNASNDRGNHRLPVLNGNPKSDLQLSEVNAKNIQQNRVSGG